jgi:hypothetical protein
MYGASMKTKFSSEAVLKTSVLKGQALKNASSV